jgi:hypothetical protein
MEPVPEAISDDEAAPELAQHGGERKKVDEQVDIDTLTGGTYSAAYAARIKRDQPEIAVSTPE